jgi:hypothetical protein
MNAVFQLNSLAFMPAFWVGQRGGDSGGSSHRRRAQRPRAAHGGPDVGFSSCVAGLGGVGVRGDAGPVDAAVRQGGRRRGGGRAGRAHAGWYRPRGRCSTPRRPRWPRPCARQVTRCSPCWRGWSSPGRCSCPARGGRCTTGGGPSWAPPVGWSPTWPCSPSPWRCGYRSGAWRRVQLLDPLGEVEPRPLTQS